MASRVARPAGMAKPLVNPSVSVVLCTFNGGSYVGEQIDSILGQSHPPDEIVIADDGSSDGTLERIMRQLEQRALPTPPHVKVLEATTTVGVTPNFSRAITAASADVVFLADQDDVWRPSKIAHQLAALSRQPHAMLSVSNARLIAATGADTGVDQFGALGVGRREVASMNSELATATLVRRSVLLGMTFAIRREVLDLALPIPTSWPHDYWLALVASSLGPIAVVPECLVSYRQHDANVVGLVPHTLRFKAARVFHSERTSDLYRARFDCLVERLLTTPDASAAAIAAIEGKLRFEETRSNLHPNRIRRSTQILAMTLAGAYRRYASNGSANALRDALAAGST
jgi:glycosyltransferase involved in cell wall biosynthesis